MNDVTYHTFSQLSILFYRSCDEFKEEFYEHNRMHRTDRIYRLSMVTNET